MPVLQGGVRAEARLARSRSTMQSMTASARGTPCCHRAAQWLAVATLATLAACTSTPPPRPPGPTTVTPPVGSMTREHSRWVPVAWQELPGWNADTAAGGLAGAAEELPALAAGCGWSFARTRSRRRRATMRRLRAWLMRHLQPYRVEALEGGTAGLITGYYEPVFDARRVARRAVPRGAACAAGRPRDATTVLDARAAADRAAGAGVAARP